MSFELYPSIVDPSYCFQFPYSHSSSSKCMNFGPLSEQICSENWGAGIHHNSNVDRHILFQYHGTGVFCYVRLQLQWTARFIQAEKKILHSEIACNHQNINHTMLFAVVQCRRLDNQTVVHRTGYTGSNQPANRQGTGAIRSVPSKRADIGALGACFLSL